MLKQIKEGKTELKNDFIEANLRLVLSLVKRFNNRGENINDIFQVGVVGLIKAIDNFDIEQPVQFSTYLISQEREKYIREKNEEPTVDEICNLTKASKEDVILAIDSQIVPMSIYDSVYNDGGDQIYLLDQLKNEKEESEELINKIAIEQILKKLSDKERYVIERRYFKNKTQSELAEELGVSQAQISRIEKTALQRIKKRVERQK